jgi:hypothetical protein
VNALAAHQLRLDAVLEPPPPREWTERKLTAALFPVFLVARSVKQTHDAGVASAAVVVNR